MSLKSHDEDRRLLNEEICLRVSNALNLQIGVSVHSIGRSIDVEQSEIKLSYKGGLEAKAGNMPARGS